MASAETDRLIRDDFVDLVDELRAADESFAHKFDALLRKLRSAARTERVAANERFEWLSRELERITAERDDAIKYAKEVGEMLTAVTAERDAVVKERDTSGAKTQRNDSELLMLRKEVLHLEGLLNSRTTSQREKRESVSGAATTSNNDVRKPQASNSTSSGASNLVNDVPRGPRCEKGDSGSGRGRGRAATVQESTHDIYKILKDSSNKSVYQLRRQDDHYSPPPLSTKRGRSPSTDQAPSSKVSTAARLCARKPSCGACKKHGVPRGACDGGVVCRRCESKGDRVWCSYWLCSKAYDCVDVDCTYLHPDQWNKFTEEGKRRVKTEAGTQVSGYHGGS